MRTHDEIAADARPGRAFSNSTMFEIWAANACYICIHDGLGTTGDEPHCPILTAALIGDGTPQEWVEAGGDYPWDYTCTEFSERPDDGGGGGDPEPDPGPPPVIDGQIDMFELFVGQGLTQLPTPEVAHA